MTNSENRRPRRDPVLAAKARQFARRILEWFDNSGRHFPWRRSGESLYRLVVTEMLLQRTRAQTVAAFYDQFFSVFSCWKDLAGASVEEIGEVIKPIGLWRQRAPRLKGLAEEVVRLGGQLPKTRTELEIMPGMGQYVTNAALLFQSVEKTPLLDSGMARVLERYFGPRDLVDIRYDDYLQRVSRAVVGSANPIRTNWAILDIGALVCTSHSPDCAACPLSRSCRSAATRRPPHKIRTLKDTRFHDL